MFWLSSIPWYVDIPWFIRSPGGDPSDCTQFGAVSDEAAMNTHACGFVQTRAFNSFQ